MKNFIEVRTMEHPTELLGKSIVIHLNDSEMPLWFKPIESGVDSDNKRYILGYDIERMNRKIYCDEIKYITI